MNVLGSGMKLNCPNLNELYFYFPYYPNISQSTLKRIRKIVCFYIHSQPWIRGLENLETLICHIFLENVKLPFLECFPKLKFLYIYTPANYRWAPWIEEEKLQLKRSDLKTFYWGKIGLEFLDPVWERCFDWSVHECYYTLACYYAGDLTNLAPTLPTFSALYYDENFRSYDRKFFEKLTNVQVLHITQGSLKQTEIVELIGWLKNLVILWLNEARQLNQSFYDILPDYHPYLRLIHIDNELVDLDLNFLLRLNHLYKV